MLDVRVHWGGNHELELYRKFIEFVLECVELAPKLFNIVERNLDSTPIGLS